MGGHNGEEDSENHAKDESKQPISPTVRRRFAEASVLALYFIFAAHDVWPESHGLALFSGAIGTCAVLLIECPLRLWAAISAMICAAAGIAYLIVGAPRVPDVEVIGTLQPGNDPTPPNGCDVSPLGTYPIGTPQYHPDSIKVLVGGNAIAASGMGKFTVLQIGRCNVLSLERTPLGMDVYADLYDADGRLIARINNNQTDVLTGDNVRLSRAGDLSTFVVTNEAGDELLYVRFMNPTTIKARGIFGCPDHALVTVKDNEPMPGFFMRNSCIIGNGVGIAIQ